MSPDDRLQSFKPESCETILAVLEARATFQPDKVVFTFLPDGEDQGIEVTYSQLAQRARLEASRIAALAKPGERALMLFPSGLEFIYAFFGCLYAGVVAVPAYPPRRNQKMERLAAIVADCEPSCVLTTDKVLGIAEPLFAETPSLQSCRFIAINLDTPGAPGESQDTELNAIVPAANDLAFLQYTSGSTGTPKGVMVSHGNLMYNQAMINEAFGSSEQDVSISWLPMFHDMGLIGTTLHPLYVGASSVFMSPASFLQKPLRWLEAIHTFRGSALCAPNFAYELCARQVTAEQKQRLDLSCVRLAVSGAEPIRPTTLTQFSEAFQACGLKANVLTPTFGLAEATLMVSCAKQDNKPFFVTVNGKTLADGQLVTTQPDANSRTLVSNGVAPLTAEIKIVDPVTKNGLLAGAVGEIWVAGQHVAQGYWRNAKATEYSFRAYCEDGTGPYMRTGDLGSMLDGELYITGRLKDVIIIRGRNHYPQDIEHTIESSHIALRTDAGAVFTVVEDGEEQLVLVQEVERQHRRNFPSKVVAAAIRQSVYENHEIRLQRILFLKPGAILKTSSGKIQRSAVKKAFLEGKFDPLAEESAEAVVLSDKQREEIRRGFSLEREYWLSLPNDQQISRLTLFIKASLAQELCCSISEISDSISLMAMGVDSMQIVQIINRMSQQLKMDFNIDSLFEANNLGQLARILAAQLKQEGSQNRPYEAIVPVEGSTELSFAQKRIWFWDRFHNQSVMYNLPFALKLTGALDTEALSQAFNCLIARHDILRTVYLEADSKVQQQVLPAASWQMTLEDLRYLAESAIDARISDLIEIETRKPFDLTAGPVLRALLLRLPDIADTSPDSDRHLNQHILLISVHHIAADGFSVGIIKKELSDYYLAVTNELPLPTGQLALQYADYAHWHREWLKQPQIEKQKHYWLNQLSNLPLTDLPTDYPRPPEKSYQGSNYYFEIAGTALDGLKAISRSQNVTTFMTVLATFKLLLMNYTQSHDICVGTPVAGRTRPELESLVGFFVNTLCLRTHIDTDVNFLQLMQAVKRTTLDAFANQDIPFEQVVEEMKLPRDLSHSPLFQVMFVYQTQSLDDGFSLGGIEVENMPCATGTAKFDWLIELTEVDGQLIGNIEYATDLFTDQSIRQMIQHFQQLLQEVVTDPTRPLPQMTMITAEERRQLLNQFAQEAELPPSSLPIHGYFENQVRLQPQAIAIVTEQRSLSYQQLNGLANGLAHRLTELKVQAGDLVGVCMSRSDSMVAALLAVLKAGAAYVPIDPAYPASRIEYMVQDSGIDLLLLSSDVQLQCSGLDAIQQVVLESEHWPEDAEPSLAVTIDSERLSHVIYTSGSTGNPKGVMVRHRNVTALIDWSATVYSKRDLDGVLAATSICFDLSVFELFVTLGLGGKVILANDALSLGQLAAKDEVVLINTVPSAISALLAAQQIPASIRVINLAGEALAASLVDRIYQSTKVERVYDLYGPSEDTTYSTAALRRPSAIATIGRPIANTQAYILNPYGQLMPPGFAGELYLAGAGVAKGYLHRADLTADRFLSNPFSVSEATGVMYRTGDLVKFDDSGNLLYLGRIDHQVKVRGFRIELDEIQLRLSQVPQVSSSLVVTGQDTLGDTILIAYLASDEADHKALIQQAKHLLTEHLPAYMVPTVFMVIPEFPLTPNGKIDRSRLPDVSSIERVASDLVAPQTEPEKLMANIWCEVLAIEAVGVECNFFELGGHSLLATQCVARIRDQFDVELPVKALFAAPTIVELLAEIGQAKPLSPLAPPMVKPVDRNERLALSFAQMRIWFLNQLEDGTGEYSISNSYNMSAAIRLLGDLNPGALRKSFLALVQRHETLRTTFVVDDGHAYQRINTASDWFMDIRDISELEKEDREAEIRRLAIDETLRSFDLELGEINKARRTRLMRTRLLKTADDEHVLLLTMHHIVSDGWSIGVLIRDVAEFYRARIEGTSPELPSLDIQYADYAAWQRQWMSGPVFEHQLAYWRQQLDQVPVLELPTDHPRPPVMTFNGESELVSIAKPWLDQLNNLSREQGVTLFMTLLSVFYLLIHRYSSQNDICVGTPVANRTRPEFESLIGCFVNSLSLRVNVEGTLSFTELLQQVQQVTLEAYNHQDLPFERLVDSLGVARNKSHSPLFQVMFTLQNANVHSNVELPGLELDILPPIAKTAKFDLTLNLEETKRGLTGIFEYNTDLFEAETIHRMGQHFERLIEQVVEHPAKPIAEFELLTNQEKHQLLADWNQPPLVSRYEDCIHTLFEQMAEQFPERIAVTAPDGQLSYEQLNKQSNQLAAHLIELGINAGDLVAVALDRNLDVIVAILGVLKSGAAYVPLDIANPVERNQFILEDSQVRLLITRSELVDTLPVEASSLVLLDQAEAVIAAQSGANLNLNVPFSQHAYIIYTSGTTGKPKGVLVPHSNVIRLFSATSQWFGFNESDVWTLFHSVAFDFSVWEIWGALLHGGRLVVVPAQTAKSADEFYDLVVKQQVTVLNQTPSAFSQFIQVDNYRHDSVGGNPSSAMALRTIVFGGEALDFSALDQWVQRHGLDEPQLINMYGITETTVHVTYHRINQRDLETRQSLIGRPIPDLNVYILDKYLAPAPIGVPGEIYVGGRGLAIGYLNREQLTQERFVPNPFVDYQSEADATQQRLYKTGDVARFLRNGVIEYIGRCDDQVKIRGYRIELGEIESSLREITGVRDAVVLAREDSPGNKRLVAYLLVGETKDASEVTAYLRAKLPSYMVPAVIVSLLEFPLTTNGKVNKKLLPKPDELSGPANDYVAPRNETEESLVAIWKEVLQVSKVGVNDNFFDLGGHSLSATQIVARVREVFNVEISLSSLFEEPTVENIALHLLQAELESAGDIEMSELLAEIEGLSEDDLKNL